MSLKINYEVLQSFIRNEKEVRILVVGPPGTGKSFLVSKFNKDFSCISTFDIDDETDCNARFNETLEKTNFLITCCTDDVDNAFAYLSSAFDKDLNEINDKLTHVLTTTPYRGEYLLSNYPSI